MAGAETAVKTPGMRGKHNHRGERLVEVILDFALLRGLIAKWSYRCGLHGRLGVTLHEVSLAKEKNLRAPLTIAFASDFHAGPTTDPAIFADLFGKLADRRPDVLLLGGDFVSCKASYAKALTEGLSRCNPPSGKYAVLGNHDLWADERQLTQLLAAAGVQVLVNRNVSLPSPFDSVSICGIDDPWTGNADAARAFKDAGQIRIFLAHSPDGLLLLDGEKFDVGFAGHTHGGQIALRDGTPIFVAKGPLCRTYSQGRFEVEGNGTLIVGRGIGCSNLPIRINADPELIICTLH
jgi:predicted MPP superfamily phosphohydrolase